MSDDSARRFLGQLDELDEQRYCGTCGLPIKRDSAVCPICVNPGRTLLRILALSSAYKRPLVLLFALLGITILFRLAPP